MYIINKVRLYLHNNLNTIVIYTDKCFAKISSAYLHMKKHMFFCEKSIGSPTVKCSTLLTIYTP